MVLIIDNYDSFTYNIYQSICTMTERVEVIRNDQVTIDEMTGMSITHLIISPGPGRPAGAGISMEAVKSFAGRIPVLGVCLGHQAIGEVFGGKVVRAGNIMHGKSSEINHSGRGLFEGLDDPFKVIRYHSLALDKETLPEDLEVTARSDDGEIMGISHSTYTVEGVQFHPESFGTIDGDTIFKNFLKITGGNKHAA